MAILVVADHDGMELKETTARTVSAAVQLGGDIHILVAGKGTEAIAQAASGIAGIAKVLHADADQYEHALAEPMGALVLDMMENYDAVVASDTSFAKNFMPRVAALLDVAQISDIIQVVDKRSFVRPIYAGNALQAVKSPSGKLVITVRTTAFAAAEMGGSAPVEAQSASNDPGLASFAGENLSSSDRPELTSAKIVISGGRGMASGENFALLETIADKLNAAVGASRAAVDAGYVPNDYQVGQTGKVVAPDLYIAVGISGAIQHLAGMKDSKVIVAINKDEDAPIFQVADYGLVQDLFTALPELASELDKVL
ncbi:MAG: electron transfer flavoprotein subunit alpha/FixB family protein [Alphaproteobacteria bacterium]